MVYPGRVLKLRVRGTKKDMNSGGQDGSSEEFSIVMHGVIARFDGTDIRVC